jgi:hypothetical protein
VESVAFYASVLKTAGDSGLSHIVIKLANDEQSADIWASAKIDLRKSIVGYNDESISIDAGSVCLHLDLFKIIKSTFDLLCILCE